MDQECDCPLEECNPDPHSSRLDLQQAQERQDPSLGAALWVEVWAE